MGGIGGLSGIKYNAVSETTATEKAESSSASASGEKLQTATGILYKLFSAILGESPKHDMPDARSSDVFSRGSEGMSESKRPSFVETLSTPVVKFFAKTEDYDAHDASRDAISDISLHDSGRSSHLRQAVVATVVSAAGWGAWGTEKLSSLVPVITAGARIAGGAVGLTYAVSGLIEVGRGIRGEMRARALNEMASDTGKIATFMANTALSPTELADIRQFKDAMKFCAETNHTYAKDQAISGAFDIAVGTTTMVAAGLSSGVSALAAPLMYVGSQATKVCLRTYRGAEKTPEMDHKRMEATDLLKKGIANLVHNMHTPGYQTTAMDKVTLMALESVGLLGKTDIHAPLSDKTKESLFLIGDKDMGKFLPEILTIASDKGIVGNLSVAFA